MTLVFLATDNNTLVTRHADHVHIIATDDEDEQATYYESVFFFLDGGELVLATSQFAQQQCGTFLGVIADGTDPEKLRSRADDEMVAALNADQTRMQ